MLSGSFCVSQHPVPSKHHTWSRDPRDPRKSAIKRPNQILKFRLFISFNPIPCFFKDCSFMPKIAWLVWVELDGLLHLMDDSPSGRLQLKPNSQYL